MPVFAIIPTRDDHKIRPALLEQQKNGALQIFELPRGEFLVTFKGTSVELSNLLGITGGENGLAIVFAINSYYGRASTDTWEWIKTHWES